MFHRNVRKRSVTVPVIPVIYRTCILQEVDKPGRLTACRQEAFNGVILYVRICTDQANKNLQHTHKTCIICWYFVSRRKKRKKKIVSDLAPKIQILGVQKYWVIHPKYL